MVICLEQGADLYTAQLMPLPLTVSCFSTIKIGFTFLVPAYPGSPGQSAFKRSRAGVYVVHVLGVLLCFHVMGHMPHSRPRDLGPYFTITRTDRVELLEMRMGHTF